MDRGAWQATVRGVAELGLSAHTHTIGDLGKGVQGVADCSQVFDLQGFIPRGRLLGPLMVGVFQRQPIHYRFVNQ